jgi:hypothetical protein
VKGDISDLIEYAEEHDYNVFMTDTDEKGILFKMMVLCKEDVKVSQHVIDLSDVNEMLRKLKKMQLKNTEEDVIGYSIVEIYGKEYKIDLAELSLSNKPKIRIGLVVDDMKVCQYLPPGPPIPQVKGVMLAKLIHLANEVKSGQKYYGDFNIPSDFHLFDIDGKSIIIDVFDRMKDRETVLNGGSTIRMSVLDTIGRRKFLPGYTLQCEDDDEYMDKMSKHFSHFDRMYNVNMSENNVKGYYGPRIEQDVVEKVKDMMWNEGFIKSVKDAKNKGTHRAYDNTSTFWPTVGGLLKENGFIHEDIMKLLFEEDHIRVEWKM